MSAQMKRRTLLLGAASALTTATLASACRGTSRPRLEVRFLEQSLPLRIIRVFRQEQAQPITPKLNFEADVQVASLFRTLQIWQSTKPPQPPLWRRWLPNVPQPQPPDLFTLGDGWLQAAIAQQLIQPLFLDDLPGWQRVPAPWQQLVRRDAEGQPDAAGPIWGAPYRTQPLIVAYGERAVRALGRAPESWADLWSPALAGRIALPNAPRLVMGLTLKKRGESVNATAQFTAPLVQSDLTQLLAQTRVFDSSTSLKALVNEDVWIAVGWSGDVGATLQRYRSLQGCFPAEGTIWTSDLWVRPIGLKTDTTLATQWIDFCWTNATARQIGVFTSGLSPVYLQSPGSASDAPEPIDNPLLLPQDTDAVAQSEVLQPLSPDETNALTAAFERAVPASS